MNFLALVIIAGAFILQLVISKTQLNRVGFWLFAGSMALVFGYAGFQSWQQYHLWKADELGKLFLPPYQSWDYFIFYSRARFFNPYLLSLLIGLLFFFGAQKLNKKYGERFFEPVEPYLLLISLFLAGTPGWLAYIFVFFAVYFLLNVILTVYHWFTTKMNEVRVPLFYLWLPVAISTIMISRWLAVLPIWQVLKF